jgi:predicted nucleotidyltransferase
VPARLAIDPDKLAAVCRSRGVSKLSMFGSVLRDDFTDASDVDVLVEFEPGRGRSYLDLAGLAIDLSDVFGREVDVATPTTLSRYIRKRVLGEAEPVYDVRR